MLAYYLDLALRSLRRNKVLTTLMVLALALGIGATITTLTVLRLLSGDPLPQKSAHLFYPQLDPNAKDGYIAGQTKPAPTMTYVDAMNLLHEHRATRQAAMALSQAKILPEQGGKHPFFSDAVMTTADFFAMFDAPFQYGGGWTAADDDSGAQLVVIASFLNDKLFGGANSVGRTIRLNDRDFRIVGVLKPWAPQPRFYAQDLGGRSYGDGDAAFLPLRTARATDMGPQDTECYAAVTDIKHLETAPCMWLGVWVELADDAAVANYKSFLSSYAQQQIAQGRFQRPETALLDLMGWLRDQQVVPDDVRLQAGLAFGFLLICVVNTVGLLLAKCLRRSQEIGVRRALGATRREIFTQFMVEAAIVGMAGGVLGLLFAELGLLGIRHQPAEYASLAHLDLGMFFFTFVVALVASLIAGILPAWRACVLAPAPQLKAA
ncbi:ABC transporter permease [Rhodanobacter soli]|uniref:ABC transport system permease protein n=1 Tax=Rhodanobacter soli TaxID=590609 RepID=A0ABV2PUA6_9GAMM